ncbi:hypothetical protein BDZ45DRAFT_772968 [Acephala macrosclerotiorum]|nr:hypothetical protein BDZ45DRAFT_772968 [Acephala macrosclerotiorum]
MIEIAQKKKDKKTDLNARNKKREKEDKQKWTEKYRIFKEKYKKEHKKYPETGAYEVKKGRGEINWYRYQQLILKEKLLLFAQKCKKSKPKTIVQENNAFAHASRYQQEVYSLFEIMKLLWPSNSPDFNAIESL